MKNRCWNLLRSFFFCLAMIGSPVVLMSDEPVVAAADEANAEETLTTEEIVLVKAAEARRIASVDKVYGAVVAVYGSDRQGGGSAVVYDESGMALTNHHVVEGAGTSGWAGLADGKLYPWKLIGTDPGGDVAIIQLTGQDRFPAAAVGDSDLVRVGDWAMAMGNPFLLAEDQNPTVTLGIVSGIKRYQPGAGLNTLVYGNCIQIDSSINPGNSGGPLFNLHGEIIGINGRGSFKERGRVNVGLGYAISSNQIKNFLPDLLATKIAQHGTLDALFGDRGGKVVCESINLDAPVAGRGLELGDELLEFEGLKITSANQFTNLISTLPADWPAHLVVDHAGQRRELWVRLFALPYQTHVEAQPEPMPKDDKPDKKDDKGKGDKDKPKVEIQQGPKIAIDNPGTIRDEKQNLDNARLVLAKWKQDTGLAADGTFAFKAIKVNDQILRGGVPVGTQSILIASDGRFRLTVSQGQKPQEFGYDGAGYWAAEGDGVAETITTSKALLSPHVSQVATLAAMFQDKSLENFGTLRLDGSDKARQRPAYRLKTVDAEGDWFYVWLSVTDENSRLNVKLTKTSPDLDGDGPRGAVTYSDWRGIAGVQWPYRRDLVRRLSEESELSFVTQTCETLEEISDAEFVKPNVSNEK